jgi:hypothetical protein
VHASQRSVVFSLAPLLYALSAFPQSGLVSVNHPDPPREETIQPIRESQILAAPDLTPFELLADDAAIPASWDDSSPTLGNVSEEDSRGPALVKRSQPSKAADANRDIYYRNKIEFSLDGGWLPINIPFPLDVFVGDDYNTYPLKYTLVPIIASLRWQMDGVEGPWVLRGNFNLTFSGSVTAIPRGPESRYFSYIMGIRRNFIPRNRRAAPYFDVRLGFGNIDAKGPAGCRMRKARTSRLL